MSGTPLTVPEARVILLADDALHHAYLSSEERETWDVIVESAKQRIARFVGMRKEEIQTHVLEEAVRSRLAMKADRYPGGNEPDFQTLAVEATAPKQTEAQALRTGIETIVRAIGRPYDEWVEQLRALLDRVPVASARFA
jgi:hypothetical protein